MQWRQPVDARILLVQKVGAQSSFVTVSPSENLLMLNDAWKTVPQVGRLEWIGLSPAPRGVIASQSAAVAVVGHGLEGDHHSKRKAGGKRQVTLIQAEHLPVVASLCGLEEVQPEQLRRNLVVSGINLLSLKGALFSIGDVELEGTGPCAPCSRMEENLGVGGFQAMRGHGGLTAVVVKGGTLHLGDDVRVLRDGPADEG